MNLKKFKKDFLVVTFLFFLVLIYFWPVVFQGKIPYSGDLNGSDLTEISLSLKFLLNQSIRSSQVPLWTDQLSSGFPLLAESEVGFFYPLNWLLYRFLPFLSAFNLSLILHFLLGGLFFYLYARSLKISSTGTFLGSLAFVLGGFLIVRLKYINMVNAAVWLPLIFYFSERFFQTKKWFFIFLTGFTLAIQVSAGHNQIVFYTLFALAIYFFFKIFFNEKKITLVEKGEYFFALVVIILIMSGLAAIQILPTRELVAYSWRQGGLTFEDMVISPYHPQNLLTFIFPYFFGNQATATYHYTPLEMIDTYGFFWENSAYLGVAPLLLALIAVVFWWRRKKIVVFLTFLCLLSLLFALGKYNPLFVVFWYYLPGFNFFRVPNRFLLLTFFALALLAGYGFDWLQEKLKNRLKSYVAFTSVIAIVLIMTIFDLFNFGWHYNAFISGRQWLEPPQSVQFLKDGPDQRFRIYSFGGEYSWYAFYQQNRGWLKYQQIFINNKELLEPNSQALWNLESIDDLTALKLKRSWRLLFLARHLGFKNSWDYLDFPRENRLEPNNGFLKVLGMQNVKYLLSFFNLKNKNLKLVKEVRFKELMLPLRIYRNGFFMPRAYLVPETKILTTDETILGDLKIIKEFSKKDFDFKKTAIVEESLVIPDRDLESRNWPKNTNLDSDHPVMAGRDGNDIGKDILQANSQASTETRVVVIKEWNNGIIKIAVSAGEENFLVVSNTYYPGWQATIDGAEAKIYRANYLFQGLKVPAGEHLVELNYKSRSYELGKKISIASLILLVVYFIGLIIIYFKKDRLRLS